MRRAIELARATRPSPNPRVGAIVVARGAVVAEAVHERPGRPHAEARALEKAGDAARGATVYVNLEPCCHHGRTPPCAPALVAAGVARVVAACTDVDQRVNGRGLDHLRAHGVEVVTGVLAEKAQRLNAGYLHHRLSGRPLVTLKLALSLDGRLGAPDGSSRWITGEAARARVHRLRSEVDAVMVGAGTVAADDPRLSARTPEAPARQPARVVVDASGTTAPDAAVFAPGADVIVATTARSPHEVQIAWKEAGGRVLVLPEGRGGVDLGALLDRLGAEGQLEVLCEGGERLATSLLRDDLVDLLELHYGAVLLGAGGGDIGDLGVTTMTDARRWACSEVARAGDDVVVVLERRG